MEEDFDEATIDACLIAGATEALLKARSLASAISHAMCESGAQGARALRLESSSTRWPRGPCHSRVRYQLGIDPLSEHLMGEGPNGIECGSNCHAPVRARMDPHCF
jgi:hypothetical protein